MTFFSDHEEGLNRNGRNLVQLADMVGSVFLNGLFIDGERIGQGSSTHIHKGNGKCTSIDKVLVDRKVINNLFTIINN